MILKTCAANPEKLKLYQEATSAMNVHDLLIESKKKTFFETIERLPLLLDLLNNVSSDIASKDYKESIFEEYQELLARKEEEKVDHFNLSLDFFWLLEKLCALIIKDFLSGEPLEIECQYPEASAIWLQNFYSDHYLLPIQTPEKFCPNLISLGQKYSTKGYRRSCFILKPESCEQLLELKPGMLDLNWQVFWEQYQTWLNPEIIPPMQVELEIDKVEKYDEMQDNFRNQFAQLIEQVQSCKRQEMAFFCWIDDPGLHDRVGVEFKHEELPVEDQQTTS